MMRKESDRRLLKLARFLEKLPNKRFDYQHWASANFKEKAPEVTCGTTACALGWATQIPEFKKKGLNLVFDNDSQQFYVSCSNYTSPNSSNSIHSAKSVFGITFEAAKFLFTPATALNIPKNGNKYYISPFDYASAKTVAKHIRKFVKLRNKYHPIKQLTKKKVQTVISQVVNNKPVDHVVPLYVNS